MPRLLLALATLTASPTAFAQPPAEVAAVDAMAADALRDWKAPGLAVVILRDGKPWLVKGYGRRQFDKPDPVTAATLFPLGSCTKAFTSALLARLADDGKLSLDDPVKKYVPTYKLADPAADALVTLRDLLAHRTGVGSHDYLWYRSPLPRAELIARAGRLSASGPFRASYHYSTIQYMVAGQAAAAAGGAPWEELVAAKLTKPLGMTATAFTTAAFRAAPDRAAGHRRAGEGVESMPLLQLAEVNPAGSVFASAQDLAPWLELHLERGEYGGVRHVSARRLGETHAPHTVMPLDDAIAPTYPDSSQVSYAQGWVAYDYHGRGVLAHGSISDGYRSQLTLVPKARFAVAVLTNLHQTRLTTALSNRLVDHFLRPGAPGARDWTAYYQQLDRTEAERAAAALAERDRLRQGTLPTGLISQYAGRYEHPAYGACEVTVDAGRLAWTWTVWNAKLDPYDGEAFRVSDGPFVDQLIEFRTKAGKPEALRALGVVFERK